MQVNPSFCFQPSTTPHPLVPPTPIELLLPGEAVLNIHLCIVVHHCLLPTANTCREDSDSTFSMGMKISELLIFQIPNWFQRGVQVGKTPSGYSKYLLLFFTPTLSFYLPDKKVKEIQM